MTVATDEIYEKYLQKAITEINALAAPARSWFAPQAWSSFSIQVVVMIGAAAFYQMTVVAMLLRPAQHGVLRAVVGGIQ